MLCLHQFTCIDRSGSETNLRMTAAVSRNQSVLAIFRSIIMTNYDTNLAAEFYVLSTLHRLGADAFLTLGNKKAVDILIARPNGMTLTLDVKGVAGSHDWTVSNMKFLRKDSHFFILVSYEGKLHNPEQLPSVWVVPSMHVNRFIKEYKNRTSISRALIRRGGSDYKGAWSLILGNGAA